jgi:hypothetical protein
MPVITVGFNKILVERKEDAKGRPLKVSSNVSVKDAVKTELQLGTARQDAVRFSFVFVTKYEPNHAEITLQGDLIFLAPNEKVEAILKEWKKDKKVPKDVMAEVVNNLLSRCNIEALILSREMNLPSPIPMPSVKSS